MTFRTLLSIRTDPITRLTIIFTLLHPSLRDRTHTRSVISLLLTAETEDLAAGALDYRDDDVERTSGDGTV